MQSSPHRFKFKAPVKALLYWAHGSFCSHDDLVFPIAAAGSEAYCYLDREILAAQGCDLSKLTIRRLKFDGRHIKKLDSNKGKYSEWIKLPHEDEPQKIMYTHELKINQIDRILLFPIKSDNGQTSLYCGLKYIAGGLHTYGQTLGLLQSTKSSSRENFLQINNSHANHQRVEKERTQGSFGSM